MLSVELINLLDLAASLPHSLLVLTRDNAITKIYVTVGRLNAPSEDFSSPGHFRSVMIEEIR